MVVFGEPITNHCQLCSGENAVETKVSTSIRSRMHALHWAAGSFPLLSRRSISRSPFRALSVMNDMLSMYVEIFFFFFPPFSLVVFQGSGGSTPLPNPQSERRWPSPTAREAEADTTTESEWQRLGSHRQQGRVCVTRPPAKSH